VPTAAGRRPRRAPGPGLIGLTTPFLRWPQPSSGGGSAVDANAAGRQQIQQALTEPLGADRAAEVAEQIIRRRPFPALFHLYYACGLKADEFPLIEPVLSAQPPAQQGAAFRLNVNAASAAALQCLPGVEAADAEALLQARAPPSRWANRWRG